jgi:hypothetical protein
MKTQNRKISQFLIAMAMFVILPGSAISSAIDTSFSSSMVSIGETGLAEGAVIPGSPVINVEKTLIPESYVMFLLGVGLIALALWGRRKFQK